MGRIWNMRPPFPALMKGQRSSKDSLSLSHSSHRCDPNEGGSRKRWKFCPLRTADHITLPWSVDFSQGGCEILVPNARCGIHAAFYNLVPQRRQSAIAQFGRGRKHAPEGGKIPHCIEFGSKSLIERRHCIQRDTGWPFTLFPTSRWYQNKSSV